MCVEGSYPNVREARRPSSLHSAWQLVTPSQPHGATKAAHGRPHGHTRARDAIQAARKVTSPSALGQSHKPFLPRSAFRPRSLPLRRAALRPRATPRPPLVTLNQSHAHQSRRCTWSGCVLRAGAAGGQESAHRGQGDLRCPGNIDGDAHGPLGGGGRRRPARARRRARVRPSERLVRPSGPLSVGPRLFGRGTAAAR